MAVRDCFSCSPTLPEMMQRQLLENNAEKTPASLVEPESSSINAFTNNNVITRAAPVNTINQIQPITDSLIEASLETSRQTINTYSSNGQNQNIAKSGSLIDIKV